MSDEMRRLWRLLAAVFLVALLLRIAFAFLIGSTFDYDEFIILQLARAVGEGAQPYRDFWFFHPPGILFLYRALLPLTDLWWPLSRGLPAVVDSLTAALVAAAGWRLRGKEVAVGAGLIYAINPLALVSAVRVGQDSIITFLTAAGLTLLLWTRSQRAAVLAGALLGIAVWFKYPAIIVAPVYVLAAPRRAVATLLSAAVVVTFLFLPALRVWHQFVYDTVTYQRTRWAMAFDQRLLTVLLWWVGVNLLAWPGLLRRPPPWLAAGFVLGSTFAVSPQTYYHYYVIILPFGALLAGLALRRMSPRHIIAAGVVLALVWGEVLLHLGPSPLYVTATPLANVYPAVRVLQQRTSPDAGILEDQYEYSYLARRRPLAYYFWNVGIIVDAAYLERRLGAGQGVILSSGASAGYPGGFVQYVRSRYRAISAGTATIWLTRDSHR